MVLIIVTDPQPVAALRRVFSRVGFVLLPLSIVLTRYTDLGRGYGPGGEPANTGVTMNKNALGLIAFVTSLGVLWSLRSLLAAKGVPNRARRLVAQGTLLAFGLVVLQMAHSATSGSCFIFGGGLIVVTSRPAFRNRPARVHALFMTILLVGGLAMLLGGGSVLSNALGRGDGLSGRTDIWAASMAAAGNPVIGTGFESFWNANNAKVSRGLIGYWDESNLNTAHNGYIEVYLELGWVGVGLIGIILISGYRRAFMAFKRNPEVGGLSLAYLATAAIYSITEAGFRVMSPSWFFLLLAIVSAEGVTAGILNGVAAELPVPGSVLTGATLAAPQVALNREDRGDSRHPSLRLRSPLKTSRR